MAEFVEIIYYPKDFTSPNIVEPYFTDFHLADPPPLLALIYPHPSPGWLLPD